MKNEEIVRTSSSRAMSDAMVPPLRRPRNCKQHDENTRTVHTQRKRGYDEAQRKLFVHLLIFL